MQQRYKFRRPHRTFNSKRFSTENSPKRKGQVPSNYQNQLQKHRRIMAQEYPATAQQRPNSQDAVIKALKLSNPFKTRSHINDYVARNRKKDSESPMRSEYYDFSSKTRPRDTYLSRFDENRDFRYRANSESLDHSRITNYTPYSPAPIRPGTKFFPEIYHPNALMSPSTYYYLLGQCIPKAKFPPVQSHFQSSSNNYAPDYNRLTTNSNAGGYMPNYEYQGNADGNFSVNYNNGNPPNNIGPPFLPNTNAQPPQFTGSIAPQFQQQQQFPQSAPQQSQNYSPGMPMAAATFNNTNNAQSPTPTPQAFPPASQQNYANVQKRPSIERDVIGYESDEEGEEQDKPKTIRVRGKDYFLVNLHG